MKGEAETSRYGPPRREALWFLELVAVLGLAFAQPIFDLLGKNPLLFVAWNATPVRTLGAVVIVVLGSAARRRTRWSCWPASPAPRPVGWSTPSSWARASGSSSWRRPSRRRTCSAVPLVLIGVVAGVLGGLARARFRGVRTWLRVLAIAPVAFAILLLVGPTSVVVFGSDPVAASVPVARPASCGDDRHGRVPAHVAARRPRRDRRRPLPEPRGAVAAGDVVPQRHDGGAVHRGRGPRDAHRVAAARPDDGARRGRSTRTTSSGCSAGRTA